MRHLTGAFFTPDVVLAGRRIGSVHTDCELDARGPARKRGFAPDHTKELDAGANVVEPDTLMPTPRPSTRLGAGQTLVDTVEKATSALSW